MRFGKGEKYFGRVVFYNGQGCFYFMPKAVFFGKGGG
jgi:hypothetical protein